MYVAMWCNVLQFIKKEKQSLNAFGLKALLLCAKYVNDKIRFYYKGWYLENKIENSKYNYKKKKKNKYTL